MQDLNEPNDQTSHVLTLNDFRAFCAVDTFQDVADELVDKAGPGVPRVEAYTADKADALIQEALEEAKKPLSKFSKPIVDDEAKQRIEAQHASLEASGIKIDSGRQLYDSGTRMAGIGYSNQTVRAQEHEEKLPAHDAIAALSDAVRNEKRRDVEIKAGDLARTIETNGKLRGAGFALSEQAIRGLIGRLESPSLSYVLGIRERIVEEVRSTDVNRAAVQADKQVLADVLRHELARKPNVKLKLRVREAVGDCYAVVSPSYAPADAPEVLKQIAGDLPSNARASWSYDPKSTSWELRASVWTPTPVHEQAVGEPFEGYVSFSSRDNGTRSFRGGGGIVIIACLNASTYVAEGQDAERRHAGRIMLDVARVLRKSLNSIEALTRAWGTSRSEVLEVPQGVKIQDVIPDFYTSMLTSRRSELIGVLPGRSKEHAQGLAKAYFSERRDPERVVRSDLAQGWTRYIQGQEPDVRREAEAAIGQWLVNAQPLARA
jgi:hypothetical protein